MLLKSTMVQTMTKKFLNALRRYESERINISLIYYVEEGGLINDIYKALLHKIK